MKKLGTKILAALLVGWYLMGIIGFDIHTCNGSGRSFFVAFFEGMTCEDIHPEHACSPSSCCANEHSHGCCGHAHGEAAAGNHDDCQHCEGISITAASCCSNDYMALDVAGTLAQDDHRHYDECSCGICPCIPVHADDISISGLSYSVSAPQVDPGVFVACDRQAVLNVWRI